VRKAMDNNLSTQAHQWQKAGQPARQTPEQREAAMDWLRKGPHLDGDLIIIPSPWFKEKAKGFWQKDLGCRYSAHEKAWILHTGVALYPPRHGKRFTPAQWLQSITRKYNEIWAVELGVNVEPVQAMPTKTALPLVECEMRDPLDHFTGDWR